MDYTDRVGKKFPPSLAVSDAVASYGGQARGPSLAVSDAVASYGGQARGPSLAVLTLRRATADRPAAFARVFCASYGG